jgi:hypothetical protein
MVLEVGKRALDGLAVDVSRVHESQLLYAFRCSTSVAR